MQHKGLRAGRTLLAKPPGWTSPPPQPNSILQLKQPMQSTTTRKPGGFRTFVLDIPNDLIIGDLIIRSIRLTR